MVRTGLIGASTALFILCAAGSAQAAAVPASSLGDLAKSGTTGLVEHVQYRGPRGPRVVRGGGGRHYGGGRRWGGGRAVGAGIAAGVIGGLIGGALLNSQPAYGAPVYGAPAPVYEEPPVYAAPGGGGSVRYCMQRYRSYNPQTGTYVGYDGVERPCP